MSRSAVLSSAAPFMVAALGLVPACSQDTPTTTASEATATTESALTGGQNDRYDDPQAAAHASIVVRLGGEFGTGPGVTVTSVCSGTLLTPTAVLTAGHCYYGFLNNQFTSVKWGKKPPVVISNTTTSLDPSLPTDGFPSVLLTNSNCCSTPADAVDDLAIYYLDTTALAADYAQAHYAKSLWKLALEAERGGTTLEADTAGRLSLQTPPVDSSSQLQTTAWVAGFDPNFVFRQVRSFPSGVYSNSPLWTLPPGGIMAPGDSGGPMFQVRADGSREAFGVHSLTAFAEGEFPEFDVWVDITTSSHAAWIQNTLTDHSHDGPGQAKWRSMHPGYLWRGEVEYTGPCRPDDADCDHWTDVHDNCPYVFNPDQTDKNDDGAGDACPACPCDPHNDIDGDLVCECVAVGNGFCGTYCPTVVSDNCPFVYNDQSNCNAEAEAARGASTLGDACDPVPCPNSSATPTGGVHCSGEPNLAGLCLGRQLRNEIHTVTIGSHVSETIVEQLGSPITTPNPPEYIVVAQTDSRFCQSNLSATPPFNCHAPVAINDAQLQFDVPINPAQPWHAVTLSGTQGRGGQWPAFYGDTVEDQTWDYIADDNYWLGAGLIPPSDPSYQAQCTNPRVGSGTCLEGTFWSHAETPVGSSSDNNSAGGVIVGVHGLGLANHYFDLSPDVPVDLTWSIGVPITPYFPWWQDPGDPFGWAVDPGSGVVLGGQPGVALLQQGNQAVDISTKVSSGAAAELSNPSLVWTSAVEPGTRSGQVGVDVVGIALSSDGTRVVDSLLARNGALVTGREASASAFAGDPPTPRSGFSAVFSRVAGSLFVLGGSDPSTGQPLHDIWVQGTGQDWNQVNVQGYAPNDVLAATFSYADDRLWILDHVVGDRQVDTLRLVRVDALATAPTFETVAQWPRRVQTTGYFLGVDRDGSILLSVGLAGHLSRTAKIAVGPRPGIVLVHTERGRIAHAPLVDDFGYSFVVQERDGSLKVQRHARIQGHCCDPQSCGQDDDGSRDDGECACSFGDLSGRF